MNKLMTLILFRYRNNMQLSNLESSNKEVRKHSIYTITGYVTAFLMFLGYIVFIAVDLYMDNNIEDFFMLLTSLLFWVFGIWNILSGFDEVIQSKDSDFIWSLPIKSWEATLANLISKYLIHTALTLLVLVFGFVITIYYIGFSNILIIIPIVILSFLVPILSINIPFLITLIVRSILNVFKIRTRIFESLLTLLLFISPLVYHIVMSAELDYKKWFIDASILRFSAQEIYTARFFTNVLMLIVIASLTTFLVSLIMIKFLSTLRNQLNTPQSKKSGTGELSINSKLVTLLLKEFRLYFSSMTYVMNTILTPLIYFILNIVLLMNVIPDLETFSVQILNFTIDAHLIYTVACIILVTLTTTTSCSISFEGKNIWIMLTSPIDVWDIASAKIIINVLLFLPSILLSFLVYINVFNVSFVYLITMLILIIFTLILMSVIGVYINLKHPNFSWNNDMEVVKQSRGTILTAVISMILIPIISALLVINNIYIINVLAVMELIIIIIISSKIKVTRILLK